MHEILTIQLGHRANHLATHFWSTQESYFTYDSSSAASPVDHDVHFRPGLGPNGDETFTPRTLIYDLKGGFGGLRKWGGLYDQQLRLDDVNNGQGAKGAWEGNVILQQDTQIPQSDYQKALDAGSSQDQTLSTETVRYWSDFNRVFYHPRSIVQINDYELGSTLMPFEQFDNGEELFANLDREDDLLDRDLRPWAEECDQMQGIQIWASGDDAWGGFASKYAERLRDEFGKISLWAWSVEDEKGKGSRAKELLKLTNTAKTLYEMSMHASMYIPISVPTRLPPSVQLDYGSQWHISALCSAALESTTLPSRLKPNYARRGRLSDMEGVLNVNGNQRVAQLQCSFLDTDTNWTQKGKTRGSGDHRTPSSLQQPILDVDDHEDDMGVDLDIDFSEGALTSSATTGHHVSGHVFGAVDTLRGQSAGQKSEEDAMDDEDDIGYARKRARFSGKPIVERYQTPLPYRLLDSFPAIFPPPKLNDSVAVHTTLATASRISIQVKAMKTVIDRAVTSDEREPLSNGLGEIAEAYEQGWDGGDESEDD